MLMKTWGSLWLSTLLQWEVPRSDWTSWITLVQKGGGYNHARKLLCRHFQDSFNFQRKTLKHFLLSELHNASLIRICDTLVCVLLHLCMCLCVTLTLLPCLFLSSLLFKSLSLAESCILYSPFCLFPKQTILSVLSDFMMNITPLQHQLYWKVKLLLCWSTPAC